MSKSPDHAQAQFNALLMDGIAQALRTGSTSGVADRSKQHELSDAFMLKALREQAPQSNAADDKAFIAQIVKGHPPQPQTIIIEPLQPWRTDVVWPTKYAAPLSKDLDVKPMPALRPRTPKG